MSRKPKTRQAARRGIDRRVKAIKEKIELAGIYFNDGAPRSAADRLDEAATMLRNLASYRDDAMLRL